MSAPKSKQAPAAPAASRQVPPSHSCPIREKGEPRAKYLWRLADHCIERNRKDIHACAAHFFDLCASSHAVPLQDIVDELSALMDSLREVMPLDVLDAYGHFPTIEKSLLKDVPKGSRVLTLPLGRVGQICICGNDAWQSAAKPLIKSAFCQENSLRASFHAASIPLPLVLEYREVNKAPADLSTLANYFNILHSLLQNRILGRSMGLDHYHAGAMALEDAYEALYFAICDWGLKR